MWESLSHSSKKKKDLGSKVHTWWPRVAVRVNWVGDRLGCLACTEAKIAIVDWRVAPLSGYQQPRLHASANHCWGVLKPVKCIVDGSALRDCDYVQSFYLWVSLMAAPGFTRKCTREVSYLPAYFLRSNCLTLSEASVSGSKMFGTLMKSICIRLIDIGLALKN